MGGEAVNRERREEAQNLLTFFPIRRKVYPQLACSSVTFYGVPQKHSLDFSYSAVEKSYKPLSALKHADNQTKASKQFYRTELHSYECQSMQL